MTQAGVGNVYAAGTTSSGAGTPGQGTPSTLPTGATATGPDVDDINEQFSGPQ